jgi:signal transduction histidine kinase
LIKEALSNLESRIEQTNARIMLGEIPEIECDPIQMIQLFQNIVGNALKFRHKDRPPIVEISAKVVTNSDAVKQLKTDNLSSKDHCMILVEDNGIGFNEKYLERIFLPFQRLHGRSEYKGFGMGLTICRNIILRHSGKITARSRPESGSTFIVILPLKQDKPDEMTENI